MTNTQKDLMEKSGPKMEDLIRECDGWGVMMFLIDPASGDYVCNSNISNYLKVKILSQFIDGMLRELDPNGDPSHGDGEEWKKS